MAFIPGTPGNDNLSGTAQQDFIDGRGGADTIDGGGGFDYLDFQSATSGVIANLTTGDGNDTVTNVEAIRGSNFNDQLTGNDGSNFLRGMLGDDSLDGGAGNDFADYWQASGPVTVSLLTNSSTGPDGNDTFVNIESISGSQFNDVLVGNDGGNQIRGQKGDDSLDGGAGSDAVFYRDASGPVTVNLVTGTASGADGNDTLVNFEDIGGSEFDDVLIGNDGTNWLYGLGGNDRLVGGSIVGAPDFDYVSYIQASAAVNVNLATGTSSGPHGADTFENIDGIEGSNFDDILTGDGNVNAFVGRGGNDRLDGGPDIDTAAYFSASGAVNVDLAAGTATGADGNDTLIGIEMVRGSRFNDTLLGDDGTNLLSGEGGDDTLDGRGGDDYADYRYAPNAVTVNLNIQGTAQNMGWGNDTLVNIESLRGSENFGDTLIGNGADNVLRPMGGDDSVDGGGGNDTVWYSERFYWPGAVTIDLATGKVTGAMGTDTLISIENARGTVFDDTLIGSSGANELRGEEGNDSFNGGAGNDALFGNAGVDTAVSSAAYRQYTLTGSAASTGTISGPDGADTLSSIETLAFVDGRLTFDAGDPMAQAYRLYFATLDRAPDALGLNFQSARLDAGTSLTDVAAGFVNSPEFQATYGSLDDAQFVNLLYQNVLDRSAAPGEIAFHVGRLQSGASRSDVVVGFSESPEHIQKHSGAVNAGLWDIDESMASVARLYFGMLERTPETSGLAFYAQQFANGLTVQQVANGFAASPEFQAKYGPLDNAAYVKQLYENILERSPGADEVAFHVNRLAAGASRGDVAAGFTEAPEYQAKMLAFVDQGIAVADAGFVLT